MAAFEIFKSEKSTTCYYRLISGENKETILESEGYATRSAAIQAIESAKIVAKFAENFELNESFYSTFVLNTTKIETVGKSRKYRATDERDCALQLFKKLAPDAMLVDLS